MCGPNYRLVLFCALSYVSFSSGGPLIMSNGELDKTGVQKHILQLETTVSSLQAQLQTQENKQAAVMSSLLSRLASTSDELSNLKVDFDNINANYSSSLLEVSNVTDQLGVTNTELLAVQGELKSLRKDYNLLNDELTITKKDLNVTYHALQRANANITILQTKNDATLLELHSLKNHLNSKDHTGGNLNESLCTLLDPNIELNKTKMLMDVVQNVAKESRILGDLQSDMTRMKSDVQSVNQVIKSVQLSSASLSAKLAASSTRKQIIAFSSSLTHDRQVKSGQALKYDKILLNSGNGYDSNTGIFTCPESGIYFFYFHIYTSPGHEANLELIHRGRALARASGHGEGLNAYNGDGNFVIIQANRRDQISIRSSHTSDLYGSGNHLYTTFSGMLIRK